MRFRMLACTLLALLTPAIASAQATSTAPRSMFSNLANPAIGMNALFSGQAAPNLDEPYGLHFDEAEISLISVVDPYWTSGRTSCSPARCGGSRGGLSPARSIPGIQLKLGKIRGTFGKHGLLHTHAFPFIQAPVIMANTIGEEGFKDAGHRGRVAHAAALVSPS